MMDNATVLRFSSDARLQVLDIVDETAVGGADMVAAEWLARRQSTTEAHTRRLPITARTLLWKLENLGWIEECDGTLQLTPLGKRARRLSTRRRSRSID